ncbi:MAG: response regulator [Patescibacteria group bacterium]|nr:response regulator [Patescibacteria group bacterium]
MPSTTAATKKEKILIIEGDGAFGEQIETALQKEGYAVTLVKEGTAAMKSMYDQLPHLVLLDVVIPGADAYDILSKKQSEPLLAKIPLFLLSIQGVPINMSLVPKGSVTEYLMALHADPNDIVDKVDRIFGHESISQEAPDPATAANKIKVLWVEDDKLISTILSKKLVSSGFDLFHAKDGEEAMVALKQTVPDVIVLDVILPGMSGFDILQKVKQDPQLARVPVMILSNLSKQSDIEKAQILGAQKFLVKAAASLDQIVNEIKGLKRP